VSRHLVAQLDTTGLGSAGSVHKQKPEFEDDAPRVSLC
jgi:hypothetical protein